MLVKHKILLPNLKDFSFPTENSQKISLAEIFGCRCSHELERDILAATSLPFLVNASLVENASKADVKRVNILNIIRIASESFFKSDVKRVTLSSAL